MLKYLCNSRKLVNLKIQTAVGNALYSFSLFTHFLLPGYCVFLSLHLQSLDLLAPKWVQLTERGLRWRDWPLDWVVGINWLHAYVPCWDAQIMGNRPPKSINQKQTLFQTPRGRKLLASQGHSQSSGFWGFHNERRFSASSYSIDQAPGGGSKGFHSLEVRPWVMSHSKIYNFWLQVGISSRYLGKPMVVLTQLPSPVAERNVGQRVM